MRSIPTPDQSFATAAGLPAVYVRNGRKSSEYFLSDIEQGKSIVAQDGQVLFAVESGAFNKAVKDYYDMIYYALTQNRPMEITPEQVLTQLKVIDKIEAQTPLTVFD